MAKTIEHQLIELRNVCIAFSGCIVSTYTTMSEMQAALLAAKDPALSEKAKSIDEDMKAFAERVDKMFKAIDRSLDDAG